METVSINSSDYDQTGLGTSLFSIEDGHTFEDLLMSALQIEFLDTFLIIFK